MGARFLIIIRTEAVCAISAPSLQLCTRKEAAFLTRDEEAVVFTAATFTFNMPTSNAIVLEPLIDTLPFLLRGDHDSDGTFVLMVLLLVLSMVW